MGRPISTITPENVAHVHKMMKDDKRCTYHMIQNTLGIGFTAVYKTLYDELKMEHISSRWGDPTPTVVKKGRAIKIVMCAVFFRSRSSVKAIKLKGQKTITAAWYAQHCLAEVLRAFRIRGLMLYHGNASFHIATITIKFLKENNLVV
ncbi:hypothetical protein EVAR_22906_1 [Eumeta japonica]|uniref:Histone-lysine N-methyltransferase SETMAR n=1 Tax=Eumeta variegata TaxID=151549 RepID=A0A4C1UVI1_EUMVA|nr:hypothetical protein EVAR_22906_1 [Eumeta japonica]